jgi:DNA-binding LytR/AlgR family response regulator
MEALKILIVEDEIFVAERIANDLVDFGYTITDNVSNSNDALKAFRKRLPDLVLMDINLKGSELDGIQLAHEYNQIAQVPIIFLTGIGGKETVERAKEVNPAYYLVKPYNSTQLQIALDFAISNFVNQQQAQVEHSLQFHTPPPCVFYSAKDSFFTKIEKKLFRIDIADLIYVKGESPGSYIRIVTEQQGKLIQSLGLKSFTEQVQHNSLLRINRSYVVNIHKIVAFDKARVFVEVNGQQKEIPIGTTYRKKFEEMFLILKSE